MRFWVLMLCLMCCYVHAWTQPNVQPSVMVVPFKTSDQTYQSIIENDRARRIAIAKVDEYFLARDFRTINFLQHLNSVNEDQILESNNQQSLEQQIAKNTNADVIVYIDAGYKNYRASDGQQVYVVNMTLSAIDVQSAQTLSAAEGESKVGSFDDPEFYMKSAIDAIGDNFLNRLNKQFGDIVKNGRPMKLSITISTSSSIDLFTEIGDDYDVLMDVLEDYFKETAFNNYMRCPIKVQTKYECDDFRIPLKDPDNPQMNYTASDYYRELRKFLRKEFQLFTKPTIIGSNLRVTICGTEKCQ